MGSQEVTRFGSRLALVAGVAGILAALVGAGLLVWLVAASSAEEQSRVEVEAPVTAMDLRQQEAVTSPVVARDPTTPDFVAAATRTDVPGPGCALQVSGDGGASWRPVDAVGELPEDLGGCHSPAVGFDDRRLVFSFVGVSAAEPTQPAGLFVVTSDDHAQTFSQSRKVADLDTFATSVAVGPEGLHTAWLQGGRSDPAEEGQLAWPVGSRVVAAGGDPTGLDEPVAVSEGNGLVAAPAVAADPEGGTVVAYYQLPLTASTDDGVASLVSAGPWRLMVARRTGDSGFGEPVGVAEVELPEQPDVVSGEPPSLAYPHLVSRVGIAAPGVAARAGQVCVAWTDGVTDTLEAFVGCSADGGQRWAQPVPLGAAMPEKSAQWLPQVGLTPSGEVEAVFYAGWAEAEGRAVDVFYASVTPGERFAEPLPLTSQSSRPQAAPLPGWFGTRLGLTSASSTPVAAWADSRNGLSLYPSQAVFAATIDRPGRETKPAGWMAGVLLVGGVIAGAVGLRQRRRGRTGSAGKLADETDVGQSAGAQQ